VNDNEMSLFKIAQQVTDEVLGKGTYKRMNRFDPSKGQTCAGEKPTKRKKKPSANDESRTPSVGKSTRSGIHKSRRPDKSSGVDGVGPAQASGLRRRDVSEDDGPRSHGNPKRAKSRPALDRRVQLDGCQLEIDPRRGVLYVHSDKGVTVLRISGLPVPIPIPDGKGRDMLDISFKFQFSWRGKEVTYGPGR